MIKKILIIMTIFASVINAANSGSKLLVIDAKTYSKIDSLNILNGGIKKNIIVKSSRISNEDLKKYNPEFFAYNGQICNLVNKVEIINRPDDTIYDTSMIISKEDIEKEIKKIKFVQVLVDSKEDISLLPKLDKKRIKSIGIVCDGKLILRNKLYSINDYIGSLKIRQINTNTNSVFLEQK